MQWKEYLSNKNMYVQLAIIVLKLNSYKIRYVPYSAPLAY